MRQESEQEIPDWGGGQGPERMRLKVGRWVEPRENDRKVGGTGEAGKLGMPQR